MSNAGPAAVKHHLSKHPKYRKKLEEMEKAEKPMEKGLQQGLAKFVMHEKDAEHYSKWVMPRVYDAVKKQVITRQT
uniref:Uncharacterized protein n=1 Tax=Ditylenchus dipsaci TaxID=166011 RepID=A0A915D9J0_9BILA